MNTSSRPEKGCFFPHDYGHKRRKDYVIEDEELKKQTQWRIAALRNSLSVVGAVFRERRGRPRGARPRQSETPAVDLRIEDRMVIQTKFLQRSTSDFFNRIGHVRKSRQLSTPSYRRPK